MSRQGFQVQPGVNPFAGAKTQREVLGLLCGAASIAWTEEPQGEFMSEWCSKLMDFAQERLTEVKDE